MAAPTRDDRRRVWRVPSWAVFLFPLLATTLGLVAAFAVWDHEVAQQRERDVHAASQAATALVAAATANVEALRGAAVMTASDAVVDDVEFTALADDLLRGSGIDALAYSVPVTDGERAAFEAELGHEISELRDDALVPAARRAEYVAVRRVQPVEASTTAVLGFDLASEPERRAAIAAAGDRLMPTLSAPIPLAPDGRPGYFAVSAVAAPSGDVVGYVSAVFTIGQFLAALEDPTVADADFAVYDGSTRLAGTADGGETSAVEIAGRVIDVRATAADSTSPLAALGIAAGAVIAGGALALALSRLRRAEAQQRALAADLDDSSRHADRLAALAERLAVAEEMDDVREAAESLLPASLDATSVELALGDVDPTSRDDANGAAGPARRSAGETTAPIPILGDDGRVLAALHIAWPAEGSRDAARAARLATAVRLLGQTVLRVEYRRAATETLLSLQQHLLKSPPGTSRLAIAAAYRPASRPVGMGGDWYDVVVHDDGEDVSVIVGDVVGHGVAAIAAMVQLSTILGGLVRAGAGVDEVLPRAMAMLGGERQMVATAQVMCISPSSERLTVVSAGHPPALLKQPDGRIVRLTEATHPPLAVEGGGRPAVAVPFPPGSCVLAYTDGLVERRGESIDDAIDRLTAAWSASCDDVDIALAGLVEAMASVDSRADLVDDLAAVVVQHMRANEAAR